MESLLVMLLAARVLLSKSQYEIQGKELVSENV